jgi:hypothetical protein
MVEPEAFHGAGAAVLHDHIHLARKAVRLLAASVGFQIDHHAAFADVDVAEVAAEALSQGRSVPQVVALHG